MHTEPILSSTGFVASANFVGRLRELGELKAALEDALAGQGRMVMLVGEPGIGKTRTAQEVAHYAVQRGAQVLWGSCYEEAGAPPYWPWLQPLRTCLEQQHPQQVRSQMGPGAAIIAEILPEVHRILPGLAPLPALDGPEQARFRLFDSITAFLKNAAQTRPLLIVVDDLHWADRPSLLLLQFLARQLSDVPLLLIGCFRDMELSRRHPLSDTLAQLSREPVFSRLFLRSMSLDDTKSLVLQLTGVQPSEHLVAAIYSHAEGNPFFTSELIRLLNDRRMLNGEATGSDIDIRIPDGVREAIGQRLNRLSDPCYQALSTASVIGREFRFSLLNNLKVVPSEEQLLGILQEASDAHLIEEVPRSPEAYQFSHALVQETLASALLAARRARLHARIGEALEELYGPSSVEHAAELAYHFGEAEPVVGWSKLVHYSLVAGERALAVYAHEDALGLFEQALTAKQDQPIDAETADLLFGLARSQLGTVISNDLGEAVRTLRRAFDYYFETGNVSKAVAVAEFPIQGGTLNLGRADIASRALSLVTADSHQAGRLLFIYGFFLYQERGEYEGSRQALEQALSIARREGDLALELRTLVGLGHVEAYHLHFQQSLQYDLKAIELDKSVDDPFQETHAQLEVASVLQHLGDRHEANRHARAALAGGERLRNRMRLSQILRLNMSMALLEGDWQAAQAFSERGLALAPRDHCLLGYRAIMEYTLGDFEQGAAYLERLLGVLHSTPPNVVTPYANAPLVIAVIAQITEEDTQTSVIREASEVALSYPGITPVLANVARSGLGLLAVRLKDVNVAKEQYVTLHHRRGTMLGGTFESAISADRLLGLLAQTIGEKERAMAHFEEALAFCRKADYRPELAWICHDYSKVLLSFSDQKSVKALLEEGLAVSRDLGMKPLGNKVLGLMSWAQQAPSPAPYYPSGLTEREVEVLRLIAQGSTNSEIATSLVLSQRTVQRHISNIYDKITARNRAEATTFFLTHLSWSA